MAASDEMGIKAAIMRGIEREFEALLSRKGISVPGPVADPGLGGASFAIDEVTTFATGYDSGTGTTTMPFTTGVSILTDGSSGDILTGD